MPPWLHWLIHSDGGLLTRVAIGVAIFAMLAIVDLRRRGRQATRWREYAFLLLATGAAMAYGAGNDLITSSISWEYFYYGKGLDATLGPVTPPAPAALALGAALVGVKATWSAGLIIGVCLLMANNPSKRLPQLPYRALIGWIGPIFVICALCGAALGVIGYAGGLTRLNPDFADMVRTGEFRPYHFMATFGVHLGGYVGGLIGSV